MDLVIDVGNTAVKAGLFEGGRLVEAVTFNPNDLAGIISWIGGRATGKILVSSVAALSPALEQFFSKRRDVTWFGTGIPIPLENAYSTPNTLGSDRLANACAARVLHPGKSCLVIDLGTCLKFDFVDHQGVYRGGSIAPGLGMRYRALHEFTARLPRLEPIRDEVGLVGTTTETSIASGVQNGMLSEIEGFVSAYREIEPEIIVLVTGGDAGFFIKRFKSSIFAVPALTLIGLHAILEHQQTHEK